MSIYTFGNEESGYFFYEDEERPTLDEMRDETNGNWFIPPTGYGSWGELADEIVANRWCYPVTSPRPAIDLKDNADSILGRILSQKVRAIRAGVTATLTVEQWFKICAAFDNSCAYCGVIANDATLFMDHFIPVRDGGGTELRNIVPACQHCNAVKSARNADEFIACLANPDAAYSRINKARSLLGI